MLRFLCALPLNLRLGGQWENTYRFVLLPIELGPESDQLFLVLFGTGLGNARESIRALHSGVNGIWAETLFVGPVPGLAGLEQVNLRLLRNRLTAGEAQVALQVDAALSNPVQLSFN